MYELALERLAAAGVMRYEISNFARPGWESVHNLKYWRLEPYLGFGADAHSFDGEWRWQNTDTVGDYAFGTRERADVGNERYWVGLRLNEGVVVDGRFPAEIERFVVEGLLERFGDRVRLTNRGVLLSNEVFEAFVGERLD